MGDILQSSGEISIGDIRQLKAPTTGSNVSLRDRERSYMSSSGTFPGPTSTGVCMPKDVITVTDANDNTGTLAETVDGVWSYTPAPGYTSSNPWGPHSIKEFYEAYNGIPTISLGKSPTGNFSTFVMTVTIGGQFTKNATNYFLSIDGAAWGGWPGNTSGVYTITLSRGTHSAKVKDLNNCGADGTVTASITYP